MHPGQISDGRGLRRLAPATKRLRRSTPALVALLALAGLAAVAMAGTPTLKVARNGEVTDQSHATNAESIVVSSRGFAVYYLTGDSRRHPECTSANKCLSFWPPVKVASATRLAKAPGVKGKLAVWHRNGFVQVTLAGHPLYMFALDRKRAAATGEGIHAFGGTWHVVRSAAAAGGQATTPAGGQTTAPSPMPTNPAPCTYPPCY